ncbi:MAG: hypothetical protein AB1602_01750 [Elusimicrobiota bacterium]
MPKIWIFNIDEVVPIKDSSYETVFVPKIKEIFPRFFLSLSPGDKIITPISPDKSFLDYASKILSMVDEDWVIKLNKESKPYSLIDSVLKDSSTLKKLKGLNKNDFELEFFIETPKTVKFSEKIGIKSNKSDKKSISDGFVLKMNDKVYFKKIAKDLGIKTVDGAYASRLEDLIAKITDIAKKHRSKVMIKKSLYGGGFGNIYGKAEDIISRVNEFVKGSRVVIEPYLNIKKVYGSLAVISDEIEFVGVDEQVFCDGKWVGFDYPTKDIDSANLIKKDTLKLCEFLKKKGVKGYVNIDWVATMEKPFEPMAMELNLRNNGFNYALDFVKRYSSMKADNIFLRYRENYKCGKVSFKKLTELFKSSSLSKYFIDSPGFKSGFAVMNPPLNGKAAIGIFSDKKNTVLKISNLLGVK